MIFLGFPCSHANAACTGLCAASAVTRENDELRENKLMGWTQGSRRREIASGRPAEIGRLRS
jgi:hypothetical protein